MEDDSSRLARRWVRRLFPLALVIVVFAALEGLARVAIWYKYGSASFQLQETLDYAPFILTAGGDQYFEFPPKPEGVSRVLILGSSTARFIDPEIWREIFAGDGASRVEIFNCAQGGYMSTQELIYFLLYGIEAKPDYVVSLDGFNDVVALTKSGRPGIPYVVGAIERALRRPGFFLLERIFHGSQLVNAARKILERRLEFAVQSDAAANAEVIENYRENIERLATVCNGVGTTYIAVLQPYVHLRRNPTAAELKAARNWLYRKDYMNKQMNGLREAMRSLPLPPSAIYVDATGAFDDAPGVPCFRDEAHLTPEGARLLMKEIREEVASRSAARGD